MEIYGERERGGWTELETETERRKKEREFCLLSLSIPMVGRIMPTTTPKSAQLPSPDMCEYRTTYQRR